MLKKKNYKILNYVLCMLLAVGVFFVISKDNVVFGATATVTVSSATATQGEEVSVTVDIKADANIGAYNFYLEYDANILEAVSGYEGGGGGRIQIQYDVPSIDSVATSHTKTVKFKAIAPGTSEIKFVTLNADDGVLDYDTTDNMTLSSKNGSVTVKAPVIASSNNNLASMSVAAVRADGSSYDVSLTPGFKKDVTKYNLSVEEGVTKLVVTAKAEDEKAKVEIQWANMDPGDNTTKIIVKAENGDTKQYTIYTFVPYPPTTTPEPEIPIEVDIAGVTYHVVSVTEGATLPEGFEAVEYDYNGETIMVGKGLTKNLTVMYLTTADGANGALYIYNEASKTFYKMVNIAMSQKLYTIVEAPDGLLIPVGFTECIVNIDNETCQGWKCDDIEGVYLVYAMNWDGKEGLYFYDNTEKQMIKYFDMTVESGVELDMYNQLLAEKESLENELAIEKDKNDNNDSENAQTNLYKIIAYACAVAVVVLVGIIIALFVSRKKSDSDDENDEDDEDDIEDVEEDLVQADAEDSVLDENVENEAQAVDENTETRENLDETKEPVDESEADEIDSLDAAIDEMVVAVTAADEAVVDIASEEAVEEIVIEEPVTEETAVEENAVEETAVEETAETEGAVTEEVGVEDIITDGDDLETDTEFADEIADFEAIMAAQVAEAMEEEISEEIPEEISEEESSEVEAVSEEEEASETADILEVEEASETEEEISEEEASEIEDASETEESSEMEETSEVEESSYVEEKIEESDAQTTSDDEDKKKKVAQILEDEESSIKDEDIDLVLDELFDDLFGE